jgi:putative FmdB family regulatory protein
MPNYDYHCDGGQEFELYQSMSSKPITRCTICGKPAERLIGRGAGLIFKGSGFYTTDYRSASYKAGAAAARAKESPKGSN